MNFAVGPHSTSEQLSMQMGEVMTVPLAMTREVLGVPEWEEEKGVEKGIMSLGLAKFTGKIPLHSYLVKTRRKPTKPQSDPVKCPQKTFIWLWCQFGVGHK
jgi:hypothetical protein